ncbi:hypothetical protein [Pseudomonas helleri]|uniref:hypothetical protein n=1 Tax=Pseudomonas helleri TaxID=1608996 RepID=UPI00242ABA60|nr:hypothetical protein [Pseudomonas helleri]
MTITLATLPQATEQQIFDQVVTHLAKQRKGAHLEEKGCAYRGEGGSMCAAGCLIADSEYEPAMDTIGGPTAWDSLVSQGFAPPQHEQFILELQRIHDRHFGSEEMDNDALSDALAKFYPVTIRSNLSEKVLDEVIEAL